MAQMTIDQAMRMIVELFQSGRLVDAESLCRQVLQHRPDHPHANHFLGAVVFQLGQHDEGLVLFEKSVRLSPSSGDFLINFATALAQRGQFVRAEQCFRDAVNQPGGGFAAYFALGNLLRDLRRFEEARDAYVQALRLNPGFAAAECNLGNVCFELHRPQDSIECYQRAIQIDPQYVDAWYNLGHLLLHLHRHADALVPLQRAVALNPKRADALNNLGVVMQETGQLHKALEYYRSAIAADESLADAHSNLASALLDVSRVDEAMIEFRRSITLNPHCARFSSSYVYAMSFHPKFSSADHLSAAMEWDSRHGIGLRSGKRFAVETPLGNRKLRIGFSSPDFRDHVVGRNILPLFINRNTDLAEYICYYNDRRQDAMTEKFKAHSDVWRDVTGRADVDVAEMIRQDRVDILIDLALHMGENRMSVFAMKPAPVQMTFAGYPGGTGLTAIDYRISDPFLDPPGETEKDYVEKTLRLPSSFWCYDPKVMDAQIDPGELPANSNGYITFGNLNSPAKINPATVALWVKVLAELPGSRMLLLSSRGGEIEATLAAFAELGVERSRIEFLPVVSRADYLKYYQRIDVGLDSFPYNGHTTSLDSMWMGVPVVTYRGPTVMGRAGFSQMSNMELTDLCCDNEEGFVRQAIRIANDRAKLGEMRKSLRTRMLASPICDAKQFTAAFEGLLQSTWRVYCLGPGGS